MSIVALSCWPGTSPFTWGAITIPDAFPEVSKALCEALDGVFSDEEITVVEIQGRNQVSNLDEAKKSSFELARHALMEASEAQIGVGVQLGILDDEHNRSIFLCAAIVNTKEDWNACGQSPLISVSPGTMSTLRKREGSLAHAICGISGPERDPISYLSRKKWTTYRLALTALNSALEKIATPQRQS